MDAPAIMAAIRATWPPSALHRVGPFDLPAERRGTRRATSARLRAGGTATDADIAAVEAARPGTVFGTVDGVEDDLADRLRARGYADGGVSDLMAGPARRRDTPPVSGFPHWPPLAVCETMWDANGNDAPRRAPAHRAPDPKTAILLRAEDRAAGALFAAIHDGVMVLHMVLTLPRFRRKGVGAIGLAHAAAWGTEHGARTVALPVESSNRAAVALYERGGLRRRGGYRYWSPP